MLVTRDSPWDDEEREAQFAYDREVCAQCGNPRSVCSDPDTAWFGQRSVCYASAELDVIRRRLVMGHKPAGWEAHPTDGVSVYVAPVDVNPDDDFIPKAPRD